MAAILREFDFDAHRAETMRLLQTLNDFLGTMEEQLLFAQKRDLSRIRKEFGRVRKKERKQFFGMESGNVPITLFKKFSEYDNHATRFEDSLPKYLRYSIVTLLYFVFEARARGMCEELARRRPLIVRHPITHYVKRGPTKKGLAFQAAVRRFLEIEVGVKFVDAKMWGDIECLEKVRNCIAHGSGLVKDMPDAKRKFFEQLTRRRLGFEIGHDGYARIHTRFSQRMQASVNKFFEVAFESAHFGPAHLTMVSWEEARNDQYFKERNPKRSSEDLAYDIQTSEHFA